jgi:hypothetical protein
MKRLLFGGAALLVAACGGSGDESSDSPEMTAAARQARDLESEDLSQLLYWTYNDFPIYSTDPDPPADKLELLDAMARAPGDEYLPYLLDLAFIPTPYGDDIRRLLLGRLGPPDVQPEELRLQHYLTWVNEQGFKAPEDDSEEYLRYKQRLFNSVRTDVGAFLDPEAERTISAQEVFWGGVSRDGIPPLDEPDFIEAADARWLAGSDLVIGVEINGDVRAYPRRIVDWHEMVNDTVGGVPVSLAYCTLCGSAILYDGRVGDEVYRFGTSGLLYRSNKLMYDRNTETLWEQYTGVPVWGPLAGSGIKLEVLPVVHTTWEEWLAAHPDSRVLDINTGFYRDYGSGVAYADYWASPDLWFPAPAEDGPFNPKEIVYAVRIGGELTAYPIELLEQRQLIHDEFAGQKLVVVATADGSGARAFDSGDLEFEVLDLEAGVLRSEDGRSWRITETALVADDGALLSRLPGHNSFWFAVTNHHPDSRLFEG